MKSTLPADTISQVIQRRAPLRPDRGPQLSITRDDFNAVRLLKNSAADLLDHVEAVGNIQNPALRDDAEKILTWVTDEIAKARGGKSV
jgi:hypothetical protein